MKFLYLIRRIIEISRPIFWPSAFCAFVLGVLFSHNQITPAAIFFGIVWSFPCSLWVSAINDLTDYETDTHNSFKGGLSGAKVNPDEKILLKRLCWVSCMCIIIPTILTFNYLLYLTSFVALLIPYIYSAKPIRLKERPPLDSLSNGLAVALVFASGYVFNESFQTEQLFVKGFLALWLGVTPIHTLAALRDYSPDRRSNMKTVAVAYGQRKSALFAAVFFLIVYMLLIGFPIEFQIISILGMIGSVYLAIRPDERMSFYITFSLIVCFFAASVYSILFNSWKGYF